MAEPVKAEGLIWLIVGVFWVVAQIAGAAAKKNQPRPLGTDSESEDVPRDPRALNNVDGFAELLRKMAGAQPIEETEPEPPPVFVQPPPRRRIDIEKLPDMKPFRREPLSPEPVAKAIKIPEADLRPKMLAFRNSVPSIKMPTMNLSFHGSETSVKNVPNLAKILNSTDKTSVRRAMLGHIIFSPPKALSRASE
jgi:hypothetical protein